MKTEPTQVTLHVEGGGKRDQVVSRPIAEDTPFVHHVSSTGSERHRMLQEIRLNSWTAEEKAHLSSLGYSISQTWNRVGATCEHLEGEDHWKFLGLRPRHRLWDAILSTTNPNREIW